jgi:hypothetical protein
MIKIKKNEREYHVALMGQRKDAYKGLVWTPEGKSPLG